MIALLKLFSFCKPSKQTLKAFCDRQTEAQVAYDRSERSHPLVHQQSHRLTLGIGEECWQKARTAMDAWQMFAHSECRLAQHPESFETNKNIVLVLKQLGLWVTAACRITEVIDQQVGEELRYGFCYETLPDHVEFGEEHFLVCFNRVTREVSYFITSWAKPRYIPMLLVSPLTRYLQLRFKKRSAQAVRRAVNGAT